MSFSFKEYWNNDRTQCTTYVSRNHYALPDKNGVVAEVPKKKPFDK